MWTTKVGPIPYITNGESVVLLKFHVHDPFNDGYELTAEQADKLANELMHAAHRIYLEKEALA